MLQDFLRFEYVLYPLWRRAMSPLLRPFLRSRFEEIYPVAEDENPPQNATETARFLAKWQVMAGDVAALAQQLEAVQGNIIPVQPHSPAPQYTGGPVRIPAQWERMERALMSWGYMYPPVWPMHAEMAEAISQVAIAEILLPTEWWARAVWLYLQERGHANLANVRVLVLPTNDVWIRDYGPIMGYGDDGQRVALNPTYAVLPQYPQQADNAMTDAWAAHHGIAVQPFELFTEGGNLWSDGQGTLIMSEQLLYSNRYHSRQGLLRYLHQMIQFDKLIMPPRLTLEETGHVDLLVKLGGPELVFVSSAESFSTGEVLRKAKRLFERETNAKGQRYHIIELPTPPLYLNWFTYTIRRAYTNALTINGCVLVPTFQIPQDDIALRAYEQALPDYRIIPINSRLGINGGGAVHCMTREIPLLA